MKSLGVYKRVLGNYMKLIWIDNKLFMIYKIFLRMYLNFPRVYMSILWSYSKFQGINVLPFIAKDDFPLSHWRSCCIGCEMLKLEQGCMLDINLLGITIV